MEKNQDIKNKLFILLNGGLGNQMFQYAAGRSIAKSVNSKLVLDNRSAFMRDFKYNRFFELDSFPIQGRVISHFESFSFWLFKAEKFIYKKKMDNNISIHSRVYGYFLTEGTDYSFKKEVISYVREKNIWLIGYWQSPYYFIKNYSLILDELTPPVPHQNKTLELGKYMLTVDSVALGIRVYEESSTPESHSRNGKLKSASEINVAIKKLLNYRPNAKFFIFCTHRANIINDINLPEGSILVIPEDGYETSIETLWLLTQCRHHIFTNSTFYWWGAWLSQKNYNDKENNQIIFAADNFINSDGICENWEKF